MKGQCPLAFLTSEYSINGNASSPVIGPQASASGLHAAACLYASTQPYLLGIGFVMKPVHTIVLGCQRNKKINKYAIRR